MRKRQKLVLIIYFYATLFLGFLYVPYIRSYANGSQSFIGHRLRFSIWGLMPREASYTGATIIDANLIIAELLAVTAMTVVIYLFFKRD